MRAVLTTPDGEAREVSLPRPPEERWAAIRAHVGGYLEMLALREYPGVVAYIDEDGKRKGLPINDRATRLLIPMGNDVVAGPALFVGTNPPDETDLPDDACKAVMA